MRAENQRLFLQAKWYESKHHFLIILCLPWGFPVHSALAVLSLPYQDHSLWLLPCSFPILFQKSLPLFQETQDNSCLLSEADKLSGNYLNVLRTKWKVIHLFREMPGERMSKTEENQTKVRFLSRIMQWISCRTRSGEACKSPCCPLLPLGQPLDTWYLDSPYILTLNQSFLLDITPIGLNFFCSLTLSLSFPALFLKMPVNHLLHLLFS